jgi:SAM-dependent methyltransferase
MNPTLRAQLAGQYGITVAIVSAGPIRPADPPEMESVIAQQTPLRRWSRTMSRVIVFWLSRRLLTALIYGRRHQMAHNCVPGLWINNKSMDKMNIHDLNKAAWDRAVADGTNPYTLVITPEQVAEAKRGKWSLSLSGCKPVPKDWFPVLRGLKVLCLASGGGQQAPIFAALGAEVTLLDASPRQLAQDRFVAERDALVIRLVEGDMADLSAFADDSFELIYNPPSTLFAPDLEPVWRECYRVLRSGDVLMTGFMNPDEFVFDWIALDNEGIFVVKHPLPYAQHEILSQEECEQRIRNQEMFHFSHSMEAQLGGLTQAGFVITGFYEDRRPDEDSNPIRFFMPSFLCDVARREFWRE